MRTRRIIEEEINYNIMMLKEWERLRRSFLDRGDREYDESILSSIEYRKYQINKLKKRTVILELLSSIVLTICTVSSINHFPFINKEACSLRAAS